jgi:tRNA(Ile)-lysidine synthase
MEGAALAQELRRALSVWPFPKIGVAVSGGSDSIALLRLLAREAGRGGPQICAVTVDHGLRPEAAGEAAHVAGLCAELSIAHDILHWHGWTGQGNLPDRARRGRYDLMADWAKARSISAIALGHTADDQAETLLMRLARGSGVDGLAAMQPYRLHQGITWLRPLLALRRADLRDWLCTLGQDWIEDPTNEDPAYDRVQARRALAFLAPLGVSVDGLVATAERMRMASEALSQMARDLAEKATRIDAGDVIIARPQFEAAADETRYRLLAHALNWVGSAEYRPRFTALKMACDTALQGRRVTLHGCLIMSAKRELRITRELAAVADLQSPADALWDNRWRLKGPGADDFSTRALGPDGLARCPDWRATGLPRATVLAGPSVWKDTHLIAAPLAGLTNGWSAELHKNATDFLKSLIVH